MFHAADLVRFAQEGAILLAPNLRAANQLRSQLAARARSTDEAAALRDRVLHWRAWTASLWQQAVLQGRDERVLLQPLQESLLWEQVLIQDPQVERTQALLDLCLSAAALLFRYNAAAAIDRERRLPPGDDVARFARWFRSYLDRCERDRLLPGAALESALAAYASLAPQTIVLCGLTDLSPAQQTLLRAWEGAGKTLIESSLRADEAAPPTVVRCTDDAGELQELAAHLQKALTSADRPDIAVIVPDLSAVRDRIDRALREQFEPPSQAAFAEERRPLWEFSTGRPLAASGVIADALHLLAWTVRDLQAGEISLLLRSRHFRWPIDAESAATLDAALLRRHPHLRGTWNPRSAARLLEASSPDLAKDLLQRTSSWSSLRNSQGSFSTFAERARHILGDFGWWEAPERTSTEFQAATRWQALLDAHASLDLIGGEPLSWPDFVQRLTSAARSTSFARQNTGAPIQFLTPDESSGIHAGEVWVLHADEERWNSHVRPHPLLGLALQRTFQMPGSSPERDQDRFHAEVNRIATIAPVATFSYAQQGEAGERRPASPVGELPGIVRRDGAAAARIRQIRAAAELEVFEDSELIPLENAPDTPVPGGVAILQSQAACAFRAFAERRLRSATLDSTDLGLDARERGSLLHAALQIFWEGVSGSAALRDLIATEQLAKVVARAVEQALRSQAPAQDRWSDAYLDIQRIRLRTLLDRWLRLEAERPDFRVVALERAATVRIGPLALQVRVDRVDEVTLPDGSKAAVVLDYKTGSPTATKWQGDRPEEPQLPLYATLAMPQLASECQSPVGAVAFAVVRAGEKLNLVSAPGKSQWLFRDPKADTSTLDGELETWRNTLEALAGDFAAGIAQVHPKEYPATCRFCEQRLLCRLNPELLDVEEISEEEA